MPVDDESWAPVARATRQALDLLGYPITPRCLPDEPDPCGGTFALHTVAHLATIKAICDHQLVHLGADFSPTTNDIYWSTRHQLDASHTTG